MLSIKMNTKYHEHKNKKLLVSKNIKLKILAILITCLAFGCEKSAENSSPNSTGTGVGGSLAKYTILDNYMYLVENDILTIYDVTIANNPTIIKEITLQNGIETIFGDSKYLYFGTQSGMLIYSRTNPKLPVFLSKYEHVVSCDPVAIKDKYAYVTLSVQNTCQRGINALEIINIENVYQPKLEKAYTFENPRGMAINNNILYLCNGDDGLKVIDITNTPNISTINEINFINANDVIFKNNILTITGTDGVYQYNCLNPLDLKFISKISTK